MKYLLLLLLISCASQTPQETQKPTERSVLEAPVDKFFALYKQRVMERISIVPSFVDSKTASGEYNRIRDRIRIAEKTTQDPEFLEMVVLHELSHMLTRRLHDEKPLKFDGCPQSMMYWKVDIECYRRYKGEYLKELFENDKWKLSN